MAKVLIVDDERELCRLVATEVQAMGHETFEAANLNQAKSVLTTTIVDVVITDFKMPDGSGMDLAIWIKSDCTFKPALIVFTGQIDSKSRTSMLAHGIVAILDKPYFGDELSTALSKALGIDP